VAREYEKKRKKKSGKKSGKKSALVKVAAPAKNAAAVKASCERHWETFKDDCSGFLKAVSAEFVDAVPRGQADDIMDFLRGDQSWSHIGNTLKDAATAAAEAAAGKLVLGGLKKNELNPNRNNGHVVVVVEGALVNRAYPKAYWGVLGGVGAKDQGINYAFNPNDRDRVDYFAKSPDKVPTSIVYRRLNKKSDR
jgi:hypothetical protein